MKKQKVFILFSHHSEETVYEIWSATTDVEAVLSKCSELDLKDIYDEENDSELTTELVQNSKKIDFGFIDNNRFVLNSFEVVLPANGELFAVFANGDEVFAWKGQLKGLFPSKGKAIEHVIDVISDFEDEDQLEEYRHQFADSNQITDFDFSYWDIIKIEVIA